MEIAEVIITIIVAIFASTGFWTFMQTVYQSKSKKNKAERTLLIGLARSEIIRQGNELLDKAEVTHQEYKEYEDFCNAYIELGGNGGGKAKFEEVLKKVSVV